MSSIQESFEIIRKIIQDRLNSKEPFKLIFSKRRSKLHPVSVIHVRPVLIQNDMVMNCILRYADKDQTANESWVEFSLKMEKWLTEDYYLLDILLPEESIHFLQNQKGSSKILRKQKANKISDDFAHNREKTSYVRPEAPYFHALGLTSEQGHLFSKGHKKYNQVNKYIELLYHLLKNEKPETTFTIADMGSGKAYLTFALYDFLTGQMGLDVVMKGYENRPDLVTLCNAVAENIGWDKLRFYEKSIDNAPVEPVDMVIALHACDIATDMAIAHGIKCDSKYIVLAPCCQKQIRQNITIANVLSPIMSHGILLERQCEILTDGMRALLLQNKGYQTKVFEFVSLEHTSKNVMITAEKDKISKTALDEFYQIKKDFGISYHHLEKLLDLK